MFSMQKLFFVIKYLHVRGDEMTTGDKIRSIRSERKLTQKELAKLSGLSEITIRKYEADERTPKKEQLQHLAEALNVPINSLLDDDMLKKEYKTVGDIISLIITLDNIVGLNFDGARDEEGRIDPNSIKIQIRNKRVSQVLADWEQIRRERLEAREASFNKAYESRINDPSALTGEDLLNILNFDPLGEYKESVDMTMIARMNELLEEE